MADMNMRGTGIKMAFKPTALYAVVLGNYNIVTNVFTVLEWKFSNSDSVIDFVLQMPSNAGTSQLMATA